MKWLLSILAAVVQVILPAVAEALRKRAEDARRQPDLRRRLTERVRMTWGRSMTPILMIGALALSCVAVGGCQPRTIYVPSGEPVRLRETVRSAKVWVMDEGGTPAPGEMDLPEGWYVLPDPGPEVSEP